MSIEGVEAIDQVRIDSSTSELDLRDVGHIEELNIDSLRSDLSISSEVGSRIGNINIIDPTYTGGKAKETVELKSSLPPNTALQPGSTSVYTVIIGLGFPQDLKSKICQPRLATQIFSQILLHTHCL